MGPRLQTRERRGNARHTPEARRARVCVTLPGNAGTRERAFPPRAGDAGDAPGRREGAGRFAGSFCDTHVLWESP